RFPRGATLARSAGWYQPVGIRRERLRPSRFTVVPVRIGIFVFDGVEELDAVGVYEVLAKAKQLHPPLDLTVRFRALKEQITGALGMKFLAHDVRRDRTGRRPTDRRGRPGDDGRRRDRLDRSGPPPPAETFRTGARRRSRGPPRIQGKPKPLRRGFIFRPRGGTVRFLRKGKVKEVYE